MRTRLERTKPIESVTDVVIKEPKLKLLDQVWNREGRQFVLSNGEAQLTIWIKEGTDALTSPWEVQLRARRSSGDATTSKNVGPTRVEALRAAAERWEDASLFDWPEVELLLNGVRGL